MYKRQLWDGWVIPEDLWRDIYPVWKRTYDPKRDYFCFAKTTYLFRNACHLCFADTSSCPQEMKWLEKIGMDKESFRALGAKVCVSCFIEHTVGKSKPPSKEQKFGG